MEIRALSNTVFHSVGEIPERAGHSLTRYREYGSHSALRDNNVNILRLQTAEKVASSPVATPGSYDKSIPNRSALLRMADEA